MKIKTKLKELILKTTGFWMCKIKNMPVGCDYIHDLKSRISLPLKTVFDVGANVGQTALTFSDHFNDATIYSFEPVTNSFTNLKENIKNLSRVKCFQLALGEKTDSVEIDVFEGEDSVLNSLKKGAMNTSGNVKELIAVSTGDIFCKENNIAEIDLLKIDTEGYELEVLHGFSDMITKAKIKAIYCEAGFNPGNSRNTYIVDLFEFANRNKFTFYGLYEVSNEQIRRGYNYGNVLFIQNGVARNLP